MGNSSCTSASVIVSDIVMLPDSTYSISPHVIRRDLADERPGWILSSYGPGKDPPEQLFGGPIREQSFEEMRLHYMQGLVAGNPQGAVSKTVDEGGWLGED